MSRPISNPYGGGLALFNQMARMNPLQSIGKNLQSLGQNLNAQGLQGLMQQNPGQFTPDMNALALTSGKNAQDFYGKQQTLDSYAQNRKQQNKFKTMDALYKMMSPYSGSNGKTMNIAGANMDWNDPKSAAMFQRYKQKAYINGSRQLFNPYHKAAADKLAGMLGLTSSDSAPVTNQISPSPLISTSNTMPVNTNVSNTNNELTQTPVVNKQEQEVPYNPMPEEVNNTKLNLNEVPGGFSASPGMIQSSQNIIDNAFDRASKEYESASKIPSAIKQLTARRDAMAQHGLDTTAADNQIKALTEEYQNKDNTLAKTMYDAKTKAIDKLTNSLRVIGGDNTFTTGFDYKDALKTNNKNKIDYAGYQEQLKQLDGRMASAKHNYETVLKDPYASDEAKQYAVNNLALLKQKKIDLAKQAEKSKLALELSERNNKFVGKNALEDTGSINALINQGLKGRDLSEELGVSDLTDKINLGQFNTKNGKTSITIGTNKDGRGSIQFYGDNAKDLKLKWANLVRSAAFQTPAYTKYLDGLKEQSNDVSLSDKQRKNAKETYDFFTRTFKSADRYESHFYDSMMDWLKQ